MLYVYNRIVERDQEELDYYDTTYYQIGRIKKGKLEYLSYARNGAEPLIVVCEFAKQFEEAAKKVWKIRKVTGKTAAINRLKMIFGHVPEVDDMSYDGHEIVLFAMNYKQIRITMELFDGHFFLKPDFVIVDGDLLGQYIPVSVRETPELFQYCEEEPK